VVDGYFVIIGLLVNGLKNDFLSNSPPNLVNFIHFSMGSPHYEWVFLLFNSTFLKDKIDTKRKLTRYIY